MSTADQQFLEHWGLILGLSISIAGTLWAGIKIIFCKGKSEENKDQRINLLEDQVEELTGKLEALTTDIQNYRSKTEERLDKMLESQGNISADVAEIKGYLKQLSSKK